MSNWFNEKQNIAGIIFVHVLPLNDLRQHSPVVECWCNPTCDHEEPTVLLHNAMDGRERFETGQRRAS